MPAPPPPSLACLAVVLSLQDPVRGSFRADAWSESDSRFSYCAVSALSLLGQLDKLDQAITVDFVAKCRNFDGGFGMTEGAESHASYGQSAGWVVALRVRVGADGE